MEAEAEAVTTSTTSSNSAASSSTTKGYQFGDYTRGLVKHIGNVLSDNTNTSRGNESPQEHPDIHPLAQEFGSCSHDLISKAAKFSHHAYDVTVVQPDGFNRLYNHDDDPSTFRPTTWAIYTNEDRSEIYIAFRGSTITMDWVTNMSCVPLAHTKYPGIKVHSGYWAEIDNEYGEIVGHIQQLVVTDTRHLVICGHSKGGALAQLFLDRLLNDDRVGDTLPINLRDAIIAITFAAANVFFATDESAHTQIQSWDYIHNFFIKGDPVPVLQLALAVNPNVLSFVCSSSTAVTADYFLSFQTHVKEISGYVRNYKVVGHQYVADWSSSLHAFIRNPSLSWSSLSTWDCVTVPQFSKDHHSMETLCELAGKHACYHCPAGYYIKNRTNSEIIVKVQDGSGIKHTKRVPAHSLRYIPAEAKKYKVSVFKFDEVFDGNPSVGDFAVYGGKLMASKLLGSALPTRVSTHKECLADGRTIIVQCSPSKLISDYVLECVYS